MDLYGSVKGPVAGCCERGNELRGSIKGGEFLDQLSVLFMLLKNDCFVELVRLQVNSAWCVPRSVTQLPKLRTIYCRAQHVIFLRV